MNANESFDPLANDVTNVQTANAPADLAALLFLGDELSPSERIAFQTRLASDSALRAEIESLGAIDAMLRADAARPTDVSPSVSDRALASSLRLVRERAILQRQSSTLGYGRRYVHSVPRWAWVSAAAAALAVGFILWVVNTPPTPIVIADGNMTAPAWQDEQATQVFSGVAPVSYSDGDGTGGEFQNQREAQSQVDALDFLTRMNSDDTN